MPVGQIKIVALNIWNGGGERVARLCEYLDDQQADVIVLTEWRGNSQGRAIDAWANANGLHRCSLIDGGTMNGVFVASKTPFAARSVTPPRPCNDPARAGVMMLARAAAWTILACYFPQGKGDKKKGHQCAQTAILRHHYGRGSGPHRGTFDCDRRREQWSPGPRPRRVEVRRSGGLRGPEP